MERQRLFFTVVIGAIVVVLVIFLVITWAIGDEEDQGEDAEPDARSAQASLVISTETSIPMVAAPE